MGKKSLGKDSKVNILKKTRINFILYTILFLFAGFVVFHAGKRSNQAILCYPAELKFIGEYSQNEGEWQTLSEDTKLSAYDGDLYLRGRFDLDLPEGAFIYFYLNHISMDISVNGVNPFELSNDKFPEMCGNSWGNWVLPALSEEDVIEIKLHNPHSYGNKNAYQEFLESICMSREEVLKNYYEKEEMPYRSFCTFILVVSIALIGTAVGYQLMHLPNSSLLLKFGFMSLFMGMYMYLDVKGIFFWNDQIVYNTYIKQLAIFLAAWMLGAGITELLCGTRKKIAEGAIYALMLADFVCMALSLKGILRIYDTGMYWAIIQGIVSLLLMVLSILELKKNGKQKRFLLVSVIVLLAVLIAELLNAYFAWWKNGIGIKATFGVLFLIHLLWAVKVVAVNYQASIRAKKLEEELQESRISLAMSQIQPHFIYNSLNSIYHLCNKDIGMAQQAISDFSDYLHRSLSVMNHTTMISFGEELKHIKTYLNLEQMRFGEDLNVVYQIETTEFMLPALSVQPLVENAVKHGICKKEEGGTLTITAKECPDCYKIMVSDDGVGFVPGTEEKGEGTHVGIRNVRQRLKILCNATIKIESEPGKGTKAIICIPKEEES